MLFGVQGKQRLLTPGTLLLGIILWLMDSLPHKDASYSALASLVQWFSTRSALLRTTGESGNVCNHFWLSHNWRGAEASGGRGQGFCETSYGAQDSASQ